MWNHRVRNCFSSHWVTWTRSVSTRNWKDQQVQRQFLLDLCKEEKIHLPQDWKKITSYKLRQAGGRQILYYYSSVLQSLETLFPEYRNQFQIKRRVSDELPARFWEDPSNQKLFWQKLRERKNLPDISSLLTLSLRDIREQGGSELLDLHNRNLLQSLRVAFPEISWPDFHHPLPYGFWKDAACQRKFMDWISRSLGLNHWEEWYDITFQDIVSRGGRGLLNEYRTLFDALSSIYPENEWDPIRMKSMPLNLVSKPSIRQRIFDQVEENLKILDPAPDWYQYTLQDVKQAGGSKLLRSEISLIDILREFHPTIEWDIFRFKRLPNNFWKDEQNHLLFVHYLTDKLKNELGYTPALTDITTNDIRKHGGAGILSHYSSLHEMMQSLFPSQHDWTYDARAKIPKNHWNEVENVRRFLEEECKPKFQLDTTDDWYRLSSHQIRSLPGGASLIRRYKSMASLLQTAFPHIAWDTNRLASRSKKSSQRWLFLQVQKLFPGEEVIEDFSYAPTQSPEYQVPFELDIYIPGRRLAFEYQGFHHYHDTPSFGPLELYQERDERKKKLCENEGVTLIDVPFHADLSCSSIEEMVKNTINQKKE